MAHSLLQIKLHPLLTLHRYRGYRWWRECHLTLEAEYYTSSVKWLLRHPVYCQRCDKVIVRELCPHNCDTPMKLPSGPTVDMI